MIINDHFGKMKPKLLFHKDYWDGPLSGVCEYEGNLLFFSLHEELFFDYQISYEGLENLYRSEEEFKKLCGDKDCERLRVFDIYQIPKEYMDNLVYNHEIFEKMKH